jgi:hypothetical protein
MARRTEISMQTISYFCSNVLNHNFMGKLL